MFCHGGGGLTAECLPKLSSIGDIRCRTPYATQSLYVEYDQCKTQARIQQKTDGYNNTNGHCDAMNRGLGGREVEGREINLYSRSPGLGMESTSDK